MDSDRSAAADGEPKSPTGLKKTGESETVTPSAERRREDGERGPSDGTTASASAYDVVIPKIRKPNEKDIIAKFQFKELDAIESEPTYVSLTRAHKQTIKNALKSNLFLGEEQRGTWEW